MASKTKTKVISTDQKLKVLRLLLIEQTAAAKRAEKANNLESCNDYLLEREITVSTINNLKNGNLR